MKQIIKKLRIIQPEYVEDYKVGYYPDPYNQTHKIARIEKEVPFDRPTCFVGYSEDGQKLFEFSTNTPYVLEFKTIN